jgi:hypothetical protein
MGKVILTHLVVILKVNTRTVLTKRIQTICPTPAVIDGLAVIVDAFVEQLGI